MLLLLAATLFGNSQNTGTFIETDQSRQITELNTRVAELHQAQQAAEQKVQDKEDEIKKLVNILTYLMYKSFLVFF